MLNPLEFCISNPTDLILKEFENLGLQREYAKRICKAIVHYYCSEEQIDLINMRQKEMKNIGCWKKEQIKDIFGD